MPDYLVREYRAADEQEWLDVHASVMVDSAAWWIAIHKKPQYEHDTVDLVALCNGQIAGFITIEINARIIGQKHAGFVWEFGVKREFRRKGIGRALIDKAHELLEARFGITKTVWFSQDKQAQQFYEHLGMREIERHWQFSIKPSEKLREIMEHDGIDCWEIRGSCSVADWGRVRARYEVIEDDDALNPRLCIGYEYEHPRGNSGGQAQVMKPSGN